MTRKTIKSLENELVYWKGRTENSEKKEYIHLEEVRKIASMGNLSWEECIKGIMYRIGRTEGETSLSGEMARIMQAENSKLWYMIRFLSNDKDAKVPGDRISGSQLIQEPNWNI